MFYPATINRIIDGDTVIARLDLGLGINLTQTLRLVGIDAPELHTEAGKAARAWLCDRILYRPVLLDISSKNSHDKYGRLLAVILADELNLNEELIRLGYAVEYNGGQRAVTPEAAQTATRPLPAPESG